MSVARGRGSVLTLSCPDKPGIVYAVSSFLAQHCANIPASQQHGESPDERFSARGHVTVPAVSQGPAVPCDRQLARLERGFSWAAEEFHMSWRLRDKPARARTPIMVSRARLPGI